MDKITFKIQANRASQAMVIQSSEITKRALLKSLYSESQLAGSEITLKDIELDADNFIKSMTFGLADTTRKLGVEYDSFWTNLIPAGRVLLCIIIENTSETAAQLSFGTTPSGVDITASGTS
jgi:hypothetical protein